MAEEKQKQVLEQKLQGVISTIQLLHPSNTKDREYYSNEYLKLQKQYVNLVGREYVPSCDMEVKR